MRTNLGVVGVSIVLAMMLPGVTVAQVENGESDAFSCGLYDICYGGGHDNPRSANQFFSFTHSSCLYCNSAMWVCHPDCNMSLDLNVQAAYAAMLDAARHRDAGRILELAPRVPGFVHFNAARGSVQISSCDRSAVIVNLPLRPDQIRIALATLPHSSMLFTNRRVAVAFK